LNVPFEPSPRGTCAAIWHGRSSISKPWMRPKPFSPAINRFQEVSIPPPSGETMPRPVTTTLRKADISDACP